MPVPTVPRDGIPHPRRSRGRLLLLAGSILACAAIVLGPGPGAAWALAAAGALGVAAALHRRRRTTVVTGRTAPEQVRYVSDLLDPPAVDERLTRLRDHYVEQVNLCVAEGRDDLVRELSDAYVSEALQVMTGADVPPERPYRPEPRR